MKKQYVTPEMEEFKYESPALCQAIAPGGSSSTKEGEGYEPL